MDPKTFAKLDPKLRETYERVMGTAIPQKPTTIPAANTPPPASAAPATAATPAVEQSPTPSTSPENSGITKEPNHNPVVTPPDHPVTTPALDPTSEHKTMHNTIAVHTAVATSSRPHEEKNEVHESTNAIPAWKKILFIVLGIIFFSIYAIFWLLFFKVKLPF